MKPHLKQWRQGMLCGMLAWGLLFVVIFIYFTDSNPAEPAPSSFSFLETRRLLPLQGKQRAIMGAVQEHPFAESVGANKRLLGGHLPVPLHDGPGDLLQPAQVQDMFENDQEFFSSQTGRKSQSAFYPEDDDSSLAHRDTPGTPTLRDRGQRREEAVQARPAQGG
ncbi:beta-galactoside alpha-2,6-sialyltransferase 2-like, partial [Suricata suricatta]|uniref:beta-galactoside alpha-2,6-sialyltransferase 2-like n=1 Tax=Suricata suricatta TaxID=37032 RepID=UPI001155542A